MKKFLVVGCGGSGAATLAYMMDQLRAHLKSIDPSITKLPDAWQFVSIDVPIKAEAGPNGLPNVAEAGGSYLSVGSSSNYTAFDQGLSQALGSKAALGEIATWASRSPETAGIPIDAGAGQYRGIGRMLTIQRLPIIREALVKALQKIKNGSRELQELNIKISNDDAPMDQEKPLIFVVSSMAGGAGASMFLDVCRLLTTIDGVESTEIATFMYTPEVFEKLNKDATVGQWPNALAMFGEAVSAQCGSAADHDSRIFEAMGIGAPKRTSIGRMFPIGSRMGGQGTEFGDGSPGSVYRGLGRALAALMSSERASHSFKAYTLANTGVPSMDRSLHGWGTPAEVPEDFIPWASIGYAQLSMGRDKYAEYAAQRLAHAAFDRLLHGHIDNEEVQGTVQLNDKLNDEFPRYLRNVMLPSNLLDPSFGIQGVRQWLGDLPMFGTAANRSVSAAQGILAGRLSSLGEDMKAQDFHAAVLQRLQDPSLHNELARRLQDDVYGLAHEYADVLANSVTDNLEPLIAKYGIVLADATVSSLRTGLNKLVEPLSDIGKAADHIRLNAEPPELQAVLQGVTGKGTVSNASQIREQVVRSYNRQLADYFFTVLSGRLSQVLKDFVSEGLRPLSKEMNNVQADLEAAAARNKSVSRIADVATLEPNQWPTEKDERVAPRFFGSANEVVISKVEEFDKEYDSHIFTTMSETATLENREPVRSKEDAVDAAVREILLGEWTTEGAEKAPADTLAPHVPDGMKHGNRMGWVSRYLVTTPGTDERRDQHPASFNIKLRPADLLERSRKWIARPDKPFSRFIERDMRSYLMRSEAANDAEYDERVERLRAAFAQAIEKGRPLAAVSNAMVNKAYNGQTQVKYRYTFSSIPFKSIDAAEALEKVLKDDVQLDDTTETAFDNALIESDKIRAVEIFGSYPPYTPIVFSSLLPHIGEAWNDLVNKDSFWSLRRTRPLPAALPITDSERRAMVAGWYVGLATGRIFVDNPGDPKAIAYIYDDASQRWLSFPRVLLTPPKAMMASYDWLPSILESILLAYAHSHETPTGGELADSLRPYHVLRALYDNGEKGPTTGDVDAPVVKRLADWLNTGDQPPVGTGAKAPETLEERYDEATALLDTYINLAMNYIPNSGASFVPGASNEDRPWADVKSRDIAKSMPLFRDIAPDVVKMLPRLKEQLAAAKDYALTPQPTMAQPTSGVMPPMPAPGTNIPGSNGGLL